MISIIQYAQFEKKWVTKPLYFDRRIEKSAIAYCVITDWLFRTPPMWHGSHLNNNNYNLISKAPVQRKRNTFTASHTHAQINYQFNQMPQNNEN